jgi:hypothetical protein
MPSLPDDDTDDISPLGTSKTSPEEKPLQSQSLDRRFASGVTRMPSLPDDDTDDISPLGTSKTSPEEKPLQSQSLDRRFGGGVERLPSLPDHEKSPSNAHFTNNDSVDGPEESFMTESISAGSKKSIYTKPVSSSSNKSPEVDMNDDGPAAVDEDDDDEVPEESFLTDSFSVGENSSSNDLLGGENMLLRRKSDIEVSKVRTVAVSESKTESEIETGSRASVRRLGQSRLSRSTAGWSNRRRTGSPDSSEASDTPEREDFDVQDIPDSPVESKR